MRCAVVIFRIQVYCKRGDRKRAEGKGLKAGDRPLSYTNAAATPFLNWFSVMAD